MSTETRFLEIIHGMGAVSVPTPGLLVKASEEVTCWTNPLNRLIAEILLSIETVHFHEHALGPLEVISPLVLMELLREPMAAV
jgi:hypothetical protein